MVPGASRTQASSALPDMRTYISLRREGKTARDILNPALEHRGQNLDEKAAKLAAIISQRQEAVEEVTTHLHAKVDGFDSLAHARRMLEEAQEKVSCLQTIGVGLEASLASTRADIERKEAEKKTLIQSLNQLQSQYRRPPNSMLNNTLIAVTKNGCTMISKTKRD